MTHNLGPGCFGRGQFSIFLFCDRYIGMLNPNYHSTVSSCFCCDFDIINMVRVECGTKNGYINLLKYVYREQHMGSWHAFVCIYVEKIILIFRTRFHLYLYFCV